LLFITYSAQAQQLNSLRGHIKDQDNNSIPGATITVAETSTSSDDNGYFEIKDLKQGNTKLTISAVGYLVYTQTIRLKEGQNMMDFELVSSQEEIGTVEVYGRTKAQEVNRQAFNVTAVDATKL